MDGFEWNKVMMAFLLALFVMKSADVVSRLLVHPKQLEKNVYIVEGVVPSGSKDAGPVGGFESVEPLLAKADVANGQKVAQKCLQCHTFEKGGADKTGPNLWNVSYRGQAKHDGYAYSSAMKKMSGQWDVKNLDEYLYKPAGNVPGTKMSFPGLKNTKERADLIAYLKQLKD